MENLKKYFLFFVFSCCLLSCLTERKANKQLKKIEYTFPGLIADKCSDKFPPIVIKDSLKFTEFISRIDTFLSINTDTILEIDTILKTDLTNLNKYNKLVVKLNSAESFIKQLKSDLRKSPPYVVKNIIDTAKIFSLNKQVEKALKEKEDYRNRYEVYTKIVIWLLIFVIILISYIYINETKPKLYKSN